MSCGSFSEAARLLGTSRSLISRYVAVYPELAEYLELVTETYLDIAEGHLLKAVNRGDPWAVKFMLDKKGYERGWRDRREITGADGAPLHGPKTVIQLPNKREVEVLPAPAADAEFEVIEDKRDKKGGEE